MASNADPNPYPSWLAQEERQAVRLVVAWPASVSSMKFEPEACSVLDITHLGCRLALRQDVTVGTYVTVQIPDFAIIEGWVAWSRDCEVGIDFSHPLPVAVLNDIVTRMAAGQPH